MQSPYKAKEKLYTLERHHQTERQVREIEKQAAGGSELPVEMPKSDTPTLEMANQTRKLSKQEALEKTLQLLTQDPEMSPSQIASEIGRSRQTVYDYLSELEEAGLFHRNGSKLNTSTSCRP